MVAYKFSELKLALSASQAANNIYDVFLAWNGGTPVIGTGPSWTAGSGGSVTAGSCARGTGAGGTALTRFGGVNVNAVSMSLIYNTGSGNNTITVAANQGVYLGSLFIDGTAGQVSCYRSYGQSRKWGIWNAFNQTELVLLVGDSTASWTYNSGTVRPSNNNTANSATVFAGLQEFQATVSTLQKVLTQQDNTLATGIGWNVTNAGSGTNGAFSVGGSVGVQGSTSMVSKYISLPFLGINVATSVESSAGASTFYGTQTNMLMTAAWRG